MGLMAFQTLPGVPPSASLHALLRRPLRGLSQILKNFVNRILSRVVEVFPGDSMRNVKRAAGNDFTSTASESQLQPELYAARVESGDEAERLRESPVAPALKP